jgi:hypothetical protein
MKQITFNHFLEKGEIKEGKNILQRVEAPKADGVVYDILFHITP